MFSESSPILRRILRFFMLPHCFLKLNWKECRRNPILVMYDFLYLFFILKTYPDNYGPCRLWEIKRSYWKLYYGSSYHPYQRQRMREEVQRFQYRILFNDKVVCEQLCKGIEVALPETVGIIRKSDNYKKQLEEIFHSSTEKKLIVKPITGSAGMGIVLAEKTADGKIVIQFKNKTKTLEDFVLKEDAIVQKLICQDNHIAQISSSSVNTIRIVTLLTKDNETIIVSATARFSASDGAFVDNWSAGGVAVGVNCQTGKLMKYAFDKKGNRYSQHPVTGVLFEGFAVPKWEQVIAAARKIQNTFPFYRLLGLDIAIRNDGIPVLIEVNASTDLIFQEQTSGPLLANREVLRAFNEYNLLILKSQKSLEDKPNEFV